MLYAFIYGVILAFGLILPLGIQNIFIFNQGASQPHFLRAMPSVLTASFCDTILILAAVLGVSVAVFKIAWLKTLLFIIGFIFLMYMGTVIWYKKPDKSYAGSKALSVRQQIMFTTSVSLLNPMALLDTIGVIGTNSLSFIGREKIAFTSACIFVSCSWFFFLAIAGHLLHKIDPTGRWQTRVNKLSALIIWTIAFSLAWQLIRSSIYH